MTAPSAAELLHLVDRAEAGRLLPAEARMLRDGITALAGAESAPEDRLGAPVVGRSGWAAETAGVRRERELRDELERTGQTDQEWAVGRVLCPAGPKCPSGLSLFMPLASGRLPMHRDRFGYACPGAHKRPATPPLTLRTTTTTATEETP